MVLIYQSFFNSFTKEVKKLCGLSSKAWGASYSRAVPSPRTRTMSDSMIVYNLCAIVITVQSLNSFEIRAWIFCSVMMSILAVASSSTITLFRRKIALQMHTSCFSPELRLPPFSVISRSRPVPPLFSDWCLSSKDYRPASLSKSII